MHTLIKMSQNTIRFQTLIILLICFSSFSNPGFAQKNNGPLNAPVNIPIVLAGNFAELRPNHFHMGIDIKTQGREGLDIFCVQDGWLSRVKISSFGYGKVLYIDHDNGTTSVYAHLQQFAPKLEQKIRKLQTEQQSWEIEVFFEKNEISIQKGEKIAISGNTGGSTAPHLHFEIRDTKTEHALNPLKNGIDVADNRAPEIKHLKIYGVEEQGYLLPGKTMLYPVIKSKEGLLKLTKDTIDITYSFFTKNGGITFGIDAFDKLNGAENVCGLYGAKLFVNGVEYFGHEMNNISFENSRYINSHRDLSESNKNMHKLFRNATNPLEIYNANSLGIIQYQFNPYLNIQISGYDEKNNATSLDFVVKFTPSDFAQDPFSRQSHYWPAEHQAITKDKYHFEILEGTFYEPTKKTNATQTICDASVSLQKHYNVSLQGPTDKWSDKRYLVVSGSKAIRTTFSDGKYYGKTNAIGAITLKIDTIPPAIKWMGKGIISSLNQIKFNISDGQSGLKNYYCYLNNEWIMLEYEYKTKSLFSYDRVEIPPNSTLRLEVFDERNNMAVYEEIINRQ